MPDLLRWLFANPILLLILIGWVVSAIGGAVQRAAKRAEMQRRAESSDPRGAAPQRRGPDPEEIAREIRRAMGLEPPAPKPSPPKAPAPTPSASPVPVRRISPPAPQLPRSYDDMPQRKVVDYDEGGRRRSLVDEMAAKSAAARTVGELRSRDAHLGEGVSGRHLDLHVREVRAIGDHGPQGVRVTFDAKRAAAAIVAMEVLGPPVALRTSPLPHDV